MFDLKRILVPVDFSAESELALQAAIVMAQASKQARIYLLHALSVFVDPSYLVDWTEDLVELRWNQAKQEMVRMEKMIPKAIRHVSLIRRGRVADEIRWACEEKSINMVVMTTRSRRGMAQIVHHNTSDEVTRLVSCPVLVLHMNTKAPATDGKSAAAVSSA
jgi:nucleotide-binding universal stress UspA family protein